MTGSRYWLALLIALVWVEPQQWRVTWNPHPDNKAIRIVYRCEAGTPFYTYDWFDILSTESNGLFHRVDIPADSSACWAGAEVIRNVGDDPANDYTGEYTIVRMP